MSIYRLWQAPYVKQLMEVDGQSDATAIAFFALRTGMPLTLDDVDELSNFMMDSVEPNKPEFTQPKIPVYISRGRDD